MIQKFRRSRRGVWFARRQASDLIESVYRASGGATPREVADLLPAVSRRVGKPVRVAREQIATEGFVREAEDEYIVFVSPHALQEFTLAHELGHIMLGHKCVTLADEILDDGPLSNWTKKMEDSLARRGRNDERDADVFADQVLTLLELTRARVSMRALRFAIGNLA